VLFLVYDSFGDGVVHGSLDHSWEGGWSAEGFGSDVQSVVMIVSGLTPVTTEWFYYEYTATLE